jgi:hypothetical protein
MFAKSPPYFARSIFADDIRIEKDDRYSVMGCFPGGIRADSFPFKMNRLAIMVEFQQLQSEDRLPITIKVFAPGAGEDEPMFSSHHVAEELAAGGALIRPEDADAGPFPAHAVHRITQLIIGLSLVVQQPGYLRVRVFRGEDVLAAGGLHFIASGDHP